jgi:XTP/dITP diphosphohydrolase
LIEEAYECVEAIEAGDQAGMQEELGDLLLQVVFHARIAQPEWDVDSVIDGITTKLVERHPHVFGDVTAQTAGDVENSWHVRKAQEKGRSSLTEGIPESLPALMRASKVQSRTKSLEIPRTAQASRAENVISELNGAQDLGDFLYELVRAAKANGWDAESSLRGSVARNIEVIKDHESSN